MDCSSVLVHTGVTGQPTSVLFLEIYNVKLLKNYSKTFFRELYLLPLPPFSGEVGGEGTSQKTAHRKTEREQRKCVKTL